MHRDALRVSIVVPVGPGESAWTALPDLLTRLELDHEIVLSAAEEPTREPPDGVRVVRGMAGRAHQLNAGIAAARAEWLWLLHADSRPGTATLAAAAAFIAAHAKPERPALGWFELAFDRDGPAAVALNARGANLRSRRFSLPFGDQGWLMTRRTFDQVGAFDADFSRGEDLEFVVRARRRGVAIEPVGAALTTSARRYREQGWLRTSATHGWFTLWLWMRAVLRSRRRR